MRTTNREKLELLLRRLRDCKEMSRTDTEAAHVIADEALLEYINNPDVTKAFKEIYVHYA